MVNMEIFHFFIGIFFIIMAFVTKLLINCIFYVKISYDVHFRLILTVNQLLTIAMSTGLQDKFGEMIEYN
jgi:hypothetical protein